MSYADDLAWLNFINLNFNNPTMKSRTNRRAGQSGRLHRTDAGDWVWSSDENDSSSSDDDESIDESNDDNLDGAGVKKSASSSQASSSGLTVNIVLRMRNPKKELNDIRWPFHLL